MDKKKVLIASVLKPTNEPRMYKKLGLTLTEFENVEVHIAGYKPEKEIMDKNIHFHSLFDFNRISFARFKASSVFHRFLKNLKPEILIVNTFELLNAAVAYKKLSGCILIYDIRENHSLNVKVLGIYPFPLNSILSKYIKNTERKASKFIDHFILAEACYKNELDFIKDNYTVLENKYQGKPIERKVQNSQKITFVFTGTAHESTGIFRAIEFVKSINELGQHAELILCVHAAKQRTYDQLKSISHPWLSGKIENRPIDNLNVIDTYKNADILLAPYAVSQQNQNKIPTKLYDALANGIPIIISDNQYWRKVCNPKSPVLHYKFEHSPKEKTLADIKTIHNLNYKDESALWSTEKKKLNFINTFLG